ncbi:MAG: undecaprenyl-diphosphate phosphatase [Candidatus Caldarchaeum sp.]|uniref:Undecaprenyl-diphosphatase n=1 Tax=Caldiarchaeum subterraneum TaxID=311458 RepID=A0A7C5LF09_CALS0
MHFTEAVFLGVLQGLAEWLPISSEGFVTLFSRLVFGRSLESALVSAIWLHLGTLMSAVVYLRKDVAMVLGGIVSPGRGRTMLVFLVVATLASAVTAVPLLVLFRGLAVADSAFALLVGLFLILAAFMPRKAILNELVSLRAALLVGFVQGFSILPGVSRSGVTVAALLLLGNTIHDAFRTSFLMSIPVVAGAQLLLPALFEVFTVNVEMIAGAAAAFVTGVLTMRLLMTASIKLNHRKLMLALGALVMLLGVSMFL